MQHLVSASVIGTQDDMTDESLSAAVHQELTQWFGEEQTADWRLLKVYRVPFAQPNQVTFCPQKCMQSVANPHGMHDLAIFCVESCGGPTSGGAC